MIKIKRKGVIVCFTFAVFSLLTLPSISAIESNTLFNIKQSSLNKPQELIKEQINDDLSPKINNTFLFIILSLLLDVIAYNLILQNYTEISLLILLVNLFVIMRFINIHFHPPIDPFLGSKEIIEKLF